MLWAPGPFSPVVIRAPISQRGMAPAPARVIQGLKPTLAEVYEELGETDFDALETALRKCDADEEDIAAVHAVLDRAGRKEEVGD